MASVQGKLAARQQSPGMQGPQAEPQLPTAACWPGPVSNPGDCSIDWQLLQSDIVQDNLALQRQSERAVWLLKSWCQEKELRQAETRAYTESRLACCSRETQLLQEREHYQQQIERWKAQMCRVEAELAACRQEGEHLGVENASLKQQLAQLTTAASSAAADVHAQLKAALAKADRLKKLVKQENRKVGYLKEQLAKLQRPGLPPSEPHTLQHVWQLSYAEDELSRYGHRAWAQDIPASLLLSATDTPTPSSNHAGAAQPLQPTQASSLATDLGPSQGTLASPPYTPGAVQQQQAAVRERPSSSPVASRKREYCLHSQQPTAKRQHAPVSQQAGPTSQDAAACGPASDAPGSVQDSREAVVKDEPECSPPGHHDIGSLDRAGVLHWSAGDGSQPQAGPPAAQAQGLPQYQEGGMRTFLSPPRVRAVLPQPQQVQTAAASSRWRARSRDCKFAEAESPQACPHHHHQHQQQPPQCRHHHHHTHQDHAQPQRHMPAHGAAAFMQDAGAGFKYQEVVRKKGARAALPAFDCPECRGFYETVGLRPDGQPKPTSNQGLPEGRRMRELREAQEGAMQEGSRHRYQYKPPDTPTRFWDMGFGDSLDSPPKDGPAQSASSSLSS